VAAMIQQPQSTTKRVVYHQKLSDDDALYWIAYLGGGTFLANIASLRHTNFSTRKKNLNDLSILGSSIVARQILEYAYAYLIGKTLNFICMDK